MGETMKTIFTILFVILFINLIAIEFEHIYTDWHSITANSFNRFVAGNDYLYFISLYGLDVYHIDEIGNLEFISRLEISNPLMIQKIDDYIYIINHFPENEYFEDKLFKIDVSDIFNPQIVLARNMHYDSYRLQVFQDKLFCSKCSNSGITHHLINPETLEDISSYSINNHLYILNDNLIVANDSNSIILYTLDESGNLITLSSSNYPYPMDYIGNCFKIYNDRYLFCSKNFQVFIYDLLDIQNPQYITRIDYAEDLYPLWENDISFYDHYLIIPTQSAILLYDIENINEPEFAYGYASEQSIFFYTSYENHCYTLPLINGRNSLDHSQIIDGTIEFESYFMHYRENQGSALLIDNMLIPNQYRNTEIITIDDDLTLSHYSNILDGYNYINCHKNGKWIIYQTDNAYSIFSFEDIENPELLCELQCPDFYYPIIDDINSNVIYFYNFIDEKMRKYSISDNDPELLYDIDIPNSSGIAIQDDTVVVCYDSNYPRLNIYRSEWDEIELVNSVDYAEINFMDPAITFFEEFLCIYNVGYTDESFYYRLHEEDYSFEYIFTYDNGRLMYRDGNLLFSTNDQLIQVFDVTEANQGWLEPIKVTHSLNQILDLLPYEANGETYLFSIERADISLFKYDADVSSEGCSIEVIPFTLSNHPNPFNPNTNIDFTLYNSENVELSIYNLKGQKIKTLIRKNLSSGDHSIPWDGFDKHGRKVGCGCYLYQLQTKKTILTNKMLLIK